MIALAVSLNGSSDRISDRVNFVLKETRTTERSAEDAFRKKPAFPSKSVNSVPLSDKKYHPFINRILIIPLSGFVYSRVILTGLNRHLRADHHTVRQHVSRGW